MNVPPNRETAIAHAAQSLSGDQRIAYLESACGGDAELRLRVEELLRTDEVALAALPGGARRCSRCGAELPAHIAEGLCPKCSFMAAVFEPPRLSTTERAAETNHPPEQIPDTIGRYKVLQRIGEGGCGVVYLAEQMEPVRRRVAIKVIKLTLSCSENQFLKLYDNETAARKSKQQPDRLQLHALEQQAPKQGRFRTPPARSCPRLVPAPWAHPQRYRN